MERLIAKYEEKLIQTGLAQPGTIIIGGLDHEEIWNTDSHDRDILEKVFAGLNINSLVLARPAEPYLSIIDFLATRSAGTIRPRDCETRTFLHDLPVIKNLDVNAASSALKKRKGIIIPGHGVMTSGTVSPEQCFVTFSSICFASFVLFFSRYLELVSENTVDESWHKAFDRIWPMLAPVRTTPPNLDRGPFCSEDQTLAAMAEAGRATVDYGLVDSYFGNISYLLENKLYISQTGSSLDELEGCIDPCPLDGSSCAGLTASSELSAHMAVVDPPRVRAMLHGHPAFTVIMSMVCSQKKCPVGLNDQCHLCCPEKRFLPGIPDIPIVPGEVGTGRFGLCNTLPPAIKNRRAAVVFGHGLFAPAKNDFNQAFQTMLEIENKCREVYLDLIKKRTRSTRKQS